MSNSKSVSAGIYYTLSNFFIRGLSIISAPIFTRLLNPEDYGIVANFTAWLAIMSSIFTLGLTYSVGNYISKYNLSVNQFLGNTSIVLLTSSILLSVPILVFLEEFSNFSKLSKPIILVLLIVIPFQGVYNLLIEYLKFKIYYKKSIVVAITSALSSIALAILLINILVPKGYFGRIVGFYIPIVVFGLYQFVKWLSYINFSILRIQLRFALKIALPLIPHAIGMVIITQIDRVMISKYLDMTEVGFYSLGMSMGSIISVLVGSINQASKPVIFKNLAAQNDFTVKTQITELTKLISLIGIIFCLIYPEFIRILIDIKFNKSLSIIPFVIVTSLIQFQYFNYTAIEHYFKKTSFIAIGTIISAVINFILNILLIPKYGIIGASLTTVISYSFLTFYHLNVYTKITNGFKFNDKLNLTILLVTSSLILLISFMEIGFYTRYSIFIIIIIMSRKIIKKWTKLLENIKGK